MDEGSIEVCNIHCRVLGWILLPTAGGCVSAVIARKHFGPWYTGLKKPSWTPPDCSKAIVRTVLHTGIGLASYLVYRDGDGFDGSAKGPLILYGAHLALNLSWAPLFSYLKNLDFAFWSAKLLTLSGIVTGYAFYKINNRAGYLFVPYVIYLGYTTALVYNINQLNKKTIKE